MKYARDRFLVAALWTLASAIVAAQAAPAAVPGLPPGARKSVPARPQTYGTTAVSYVEIPASAFVPADSNTPYASDNYGASARWPKGGSETFSAPLHLPSGALVTYFELDYLDNNAFATTYAGLYACDYLGQNCTVHPSAGAGPGDCLLAGFICTGVADANPFFTHAAADLSGEGIVADNFGGSMSLVVSPEADDGSEKLAGVIVGYVLQVGVPPGTPTFNDVPAVDPGFPYIEALYAAGVTGGCGGGSYCPDNPVTRRQMAVFIAKALGLQWP